MIGIDANVLIYAYDVDAGTKHRKAAHILEDIWNEKLKTTITAQSLGEFYRVVTRKMQPPMPPQDARQIVEDVVSSPMIKIVGYNEKTLLHAMQKGQSVRRFWDTLIATTLLEHGVDKIYTENVKDFSGTGIEAVNPFCA